MPFRLDGQPVRAAAPRAAVLLRPADARVPGPGRRPGLRHARSWSRRTSSTCCARELARPSWAREHVALGTNTDPYQRAEGRYRLMPGIIEALADSGTPLSILTKGTLLRRDLPLLAEAARQVPVGIGVSLAIGDEACSRPSSRARRRPRARLDLIRAVRDAGLPCGVMVAPVLPWLTDGRGAARLAAARPGRRRRDRGDGAPAAPARTGQAALPRVAARARACASCAGTRSSTGAAPTRRASTSAWLDERVRPAARPARLRRPVPPPRRA